MKISEAITKAIEGCEDKKLAEIRFLDRPESELFLDPYFWQALGRRLQWTKVIMGKDAFLFNDGQILPESPLVDEWKMQWHWFIEWLAKGKSAKTFFETIN